MKKQYEKVIKNLKNKLVQKNEMYQEYLYRAVILLIADEKFPNPKLIIDKPKLDLSK